MNKSGLLLGFDFGLRQIGVSVGQTVTASARPLCILDAKSGQPSWQQVTSLIEEWRPDYLVVGLPLHMDGSEGASAQSARKFAARLHGRFGCRVELQDERLSSREARSQLNDMQTTNGNSARVAHNKIDAVAAALILQSWLDSGNG